MSERANALIRRKLHEGADKRTTRERTDDGDLNMAWDFDDHAAAHAKAQQLANIHHREVGITKQPTGKHRVRHLSGMESRHFVSKSDQRVSPNTHADGTLIKDEDVVQFGDLKPGERFRFFQSKPVNVKHNGDAYTAPNTMDGKLMFYTPHRTVQRMPADPSATQPLRRAPLRRRTR